MLYLKGNILLVAIRTGASPLLKQIFSQLIASKRALLVCASFDIGVLHRLGIEANQLHANRGTRTQTHQSFDPGGDIADPTPERWGKPSLGPSSILKTGLSVSGQSAPACTPYCSSNIQSFLDLLSPMGQFCGEDHL